MPVTNGKPRIIWSQRDWRSVMLALGLNSALRNVYLLCDFQGFSVNQAAAILDIGVPAVNARLTRARREIVAGLQMEH